jgi:hypothetical protein
MKHVPLLLAAAVVVAACSGGNGPLPRGKASAALVNL